MSTKYLGQTLDIHGGGLDLQFPHHENELAQTESYTDQPFARYWMHNGLMRVRKQAGKVGGRGQGEQAEEVEKMGGSLNNAINVKEVLAHFDAETLRMLLLGTHYRSPIDYGDERLSEVRRSLESFYRFFERYQRISSESFYALPVMSSLASSPSKALPDSSPWRSFWATFVEHMEDDFNTGGGVAVLYELLNKLNRFADEKKVDAGTAEDVVEWKRGVLVLRERSQVLGRFWEPQAKKGGDDQVVAGLMQLLIDLRNEARKAKNFALGDKIRARLKELNITLEDRPGGKTDWRIE